MPEDVRSLVLVVDVDRVEALGQAHLLLFDGFERHAKGLSDSDL